MKREREREGERDSSTLQLHCFKTYGQQLITPIIINKNFLPLVHIYAYGCI
jgi:hypothetical protein